MVWADAAQRFGLVGRDWGSGSIPGEEGMPAFRDRVWRGLITLAERHAEETAIAVIHGGVLGAFVARMMGLEDREYAQIFASNCGITTVGVGLDGAPGIDVLNDVCHLRSLGRCREGALASVAVVTAAFRAC